MSLPIIWATTGRPVDVIGAILLVIGIGGVILAADRWRYIATADILGSAAVGIFALLVLVYHEGHTTEPMIPASLFHRRIIVVGGLG